jgi:hypothetical protein
MKTHMINIFVIFLSSVALIACAGGSGWIQINPEKKACYEVPIEDSLFCEHMAGFWDEANFMIRLANAAALENNLYDAHQASLVIGKLLDYLEMENVAYAIFMSAVVKYAGPLTSVILQEGVDMYLNIQEPMKPFDKELARRELLRHKLLIDSVLSRAAARGVYVPAE